MMQERAEHYLIWVSRELDRLESLDADGGMTTLAVEDRLAMRAEWHDVVDRYLAVVGAYDAGRLRRDLYARLFDVSARLLSLLPLLERMRLRTPDADLLARLRLAAAS